MRQEFCACESSNPHTLWLHGSGSLVYPEPAACGAYLTNGRSNWQRELASNAVQGRRVLKCGERDVRREIEQAGAREGGSQHTATQAEDLDAGAMVSSSRVQSTRHPWVALAVRLQASGQHDHNIGRIRIGRRRATCTRLLHHLGRLLPRRARRPSRGLRALHRWWLIVGICLPLGGLLQAAHGCVELEAQLGRRHRTPLLVRQTCCNGGVVSLPLVGAAVVDGALQLRSEWEVALRRAAGRRLDAREWRVRRLAIHCGPISTAVSHASAGQAAVGSVWRSSPSRHADCASRAAGSMDLVSAVLTTS